MKLGLIKGRSSLSLVVVLVSTCGCESDAETLAELMMLERELGEIREIFLYASSSGQSPTGPA